MKNPIMTFGVLFLISTILFSCEKIKIDENACTGACKSVRLSGRLYDVFSNTGISNVPVSAHFYQYKSTCFFCIDKPVDTKSQTTTDNLGRFNFDIIVDTAVFNATYHYALYVSSAAAQGYIDGNYADYAQYQPRFDSIELYKYKKAVLNVQIKRDSADLFNSYEILSAFYDNINHRVVEYADNSVPFFIRSYSPVLNDTIIQTESAAHFYTSFTGRKLVNNGWVISARDSVFCIANTVNNFLIKY